MTAWEDEVVEMLGGRVASLLSRDELVDLGNRIESALNAWEDRDMKTMLTRTAEVYGEIVRRPHCSTICPEHIASRITVIYRLIEELEDDPNA